MRRFFLFSRLVFVTALLVFLSAAEGRLVILPGPDDSLDRCDTKLAPYSPSVPVEGLRGIVQYFPKLCAFNSTVPEAIDEAKRVWLFDTCSDLHIWSIIQVGNSKADALVFTGSNFTARRVDRRDVKVPVLSISGKVPSEIKQRIAEDNQVEVLIDPHRADWFNCEEFESLELVYAILAPCWLCVSILWSLNTYKRPHVSVNHLHRFMTVAPVIKTGVSMAGFLMFVQCRNTQLQDRATTYFAMCYLWLSTMYVTVFFTVVLLLSKGWMLTREVFSRKESMTVAILVGLVYVVQSANQLNPTLLMPALLLLYGVLAVISIKSPTPPTRLAHRQIAAPPRFLPPSLVRLCCTGHASGTCTICNCASSTSASTGWRCSSGPSSSSCSCSASSNTRWRSSSSPCSSAGASCRRCWASGRPAMWCWRCWTSVCGWCWPSPSARGRPFSTGTSSSGRSHPTTSYPCTTPCKTPTTAAGPALLADTRLPHSRWQHRLFLRASRLLSWCSTPLSLSTRGNEERTTTSHVAPLAAAAARRPRRCRPTRGTLCPMWFSAHHVAGRLHIMRTEEGRGRAVRGTRLVAGGCRRVPCRGLCWSRQKGTGTTGRITELPTTAVTKGGGDIDMGGMPG